MPRSYTLAAVGFVTAMAIGAVAGCYRAGGSGTPWPRESDFKYVLAEDTPYFDQGCAASKTDGVLPRGTRYAIVGGDDQCKRIWTKQGKRTYIRP